MLIDKTPFELGYVMPAEWERHYATWISWPKNQESFRGSVLAEVEGAYLKIVEELSKGERVEILVDNEDEKARVAKMLDSTGSLKENIGFHAISTTDVWIRDYGPIFIKRSDIRRIDIAYTHWKFNAWGMKYEGMAEDTHVPEKMPLREFKGFRIPIVLEGGSIDTNGIGTFLTTEQCLLNKNRNPELSRGKIEGFLRSYLGAFNVIWLGEGLEGDDTDGHVDDIARFVSRNTVVCAYEEDSSDANYEALDRNFRILQGSEDQDGKKLNVIKMPMPGKVEKDGMRLPASYMNFYISNKSVLVPIFAVENDKKAIDILKELFPGRNIVGIDCRGLIEGFGAIHCATQQQPSH
jgi:agmatine deiminase